MIQMNKKDFEKADFKELIGALMLKLDNLHTTEDLKEHVIECIHKDNYNCAIRILKRLITEPADYYCYDYANDTINISFASIFVYPMPIRTKQDLLCTNYFKLVNEEPLLTDKMLSVLKNILLEECRINNFVYFDFFNENPKNDDPKHLSAKIDETIAQMPEEELITFYKKYVNLSGREKR